MPSIAYLNTPDFEPARWQQTYLLLVKYHGTGTAVFTPVEPTPAFIDFITAKQHREIEVTKLVYEESEEDTGMYRVALTDLFALDLSSHTQFNKRRGNQF